MFSQNDKISVRQLQIMMILTMFASVSLTLPRTTAEIANQDGWMLVIGATFLMIGYAYLIITLGKMFPQQTFVEYSGEILTRPIGAIIVLVFIIKAVVFFGLEVRVFSELVKQTLLTKTPIEFIMIAFMFTLVFLTRKGIECRARLCEIIIFLALIPIFFILLVSIKDVKIENMAPFFALSYKDFFSGSYLLSIKAVGIEFLLLTLGYLRTQRHVTKAVFQSIALFMVIGFIINFVTLGIFGYKCTARLIWPVMNIMQVVQIPGSFIERQDALMMSFWILTMVVINSAYLFYGSLATSKLFKTKENNWVNLLILPIAYFIALGPDNVPDTYEVMTRLSKTYGLIFLLPVPLLLLVVAKIRKLGVQNETQ
ncbi:MAG: endospore germination permease [Vallitaleaceae bacterium]|nr:endospore germination permease [Vallitaleaceae bacterium]